MCYDIKASLEAQLNKARRVNDLQAIEEIIEKLAPLTDLPIYHASGFSHPEMLIYTNRSPNFPEVATWGLVPHWVNDEEQLKKLWNNTLNARGETIFEKPSFRTAAEHNRCVVYVDGFYEHHHFEGNVYPYYIRRKDKKPMVLAGLWSEWTNPNSGGVVNTFTIVTTVGNPLMAKIHNNPKLKEPRMPVILTSESEEEWLKPFESNTDRENIVKNIKPLSEDLLEAYTVRRLRGKEYLGNVEEISEEFEYQELNNL
ncbi:SOS response-associated peptidase [Ulvibacter antarcticus]|uniref:Abasic site processing protein n=1 Tax=Ulvibacter antarcticus TaxID=442714 RepID=A0A3L9YBQ0_9FLAO|nr:SOS response-associated peptidase [Ulvibacter antarcticus]RMA58061.1 putative SOS response-associated peptidase YedK [Ulvibacter antarcticus]